MPPSNGPGQCGPASTGSPATALAIAHGSPADHTVRRLLPHLDNHAVGFAAARQLALQYDDLSDVTPAVGAHLLLPEGYRLAATSLGIDPTRCLVVEDAEPSLHAARAAGAPTAALKGLPADLRIDDLAHLARLLTQARPRPS